jgi:hypothetical protein
MSDATIRYTINGSNPTITSGTIYTEPICIAYTATVRAIAYKDNCATPSSVARADYIINIPNPCFTVSPVSGSILTTFTFDASCSTSPGGSTLQYRWDFNNDGIWDRDFSTSKTTTYQYTTPGTYTIKLEIRNGIGCDNSTTKEVKVGLFEGFENGLPTDWENGGDMPWVIRTYVCSGNYSVTADNCTIEGQKSWLRKIVNGPVIVKFDLQTQFVTNGRAKSDFSLSVNIDNNTGLFIDYGAKLGCTSSYPPYLPCGCSNYTIQVPSGDHTLEWLCTYDGSGGSFIYLDNVEIIPIVE